MTLYDVLFWLLIGGTQAAIVAFVVMYVRGR